jgi:hypothetical protein
MAGWTFLGTWDRSCDPRNGSHASFLIRGEVTEAEARILVNQYYSDVVRRVETWAKSLSIG